MEPAAPIGSGDDWESEPIGPDDLTIRTPNGTVAEAESWLALVHSTLRKPGGFLIVSSGPPNMYAQAINHEGGASYSSTGMVSPISTSRRRTCPWPRSPMPCRNGCVAIEPSSMIMNGNHCRSSEPPRILEWALRRHRG